MVAVAREQRNNARTVKDLRLCDVPMYGVSHAERESSGNGWHTTNAVSVVCYTFCGDLCGKISLPSGRVVLEHRESGGYLRAEVSK